MSSNYMIYVGTYSSSDCGEIYAYKMDSSTGSLQYQSKATGITNPSFLALDPMSRYLFAVSEIDEFQGQATGIVTAYHVSSVTGELSYINQQLTHGTAPCHLQVTAMGRFLLLSNYGSGSVISFPIHVDGSLGEAVSFIQHEGSSINQSRQQGPHAHSINLDQANRFAFAADLGTDRVMSYRFNVDSGQLEPHDPPFVIVGPGAGPRHFDFHPTGQYAYLINELHSTITAFHYDSEKGALESIQTVSTLPEGFDEDTAGADIHVSPDGRFVYGSNRGHNSIARFSVSAATGRLIPIGHTPTQGAIPRNFGIDPTGTFLLAANQNSNTIITFRIDTASGDLIPTGNLKDIPMPVCIKFMPIE